MTYSFRKTHLAITFLLIATVGSSYGTETNYNSSAAISEECSPETNCCTSCGHFFFEAGVLCLRAYEGGITNACDGTTTTNAIEGGVLVSTLNGNAHDLDFQWNAGFRLGVGYQFADSECGVGLFWTHFNSHSHNNNRFSNRRFKIDFDAVDLVYGCEYSFTSCFSLVPYAGLKYANIHQRFGTGVINSFTDLTGATPLVTSSVSTGSLRENFWGVGPELGLDGDWNLGCGFSLFGDVSLAFLYGRFHVNSYQTGLFTTGINVNNLNKRLQACQLALDAEIGVRWKTCVCCMPLTVQLALEQHRYFNHNQFCGYGDLVLDGGSLAFAIEY